MEKRINLSGNLSTSACRLLMIFANSLEPDFFFSQKINSTPWQNSQCIIKYRMIDMQAGGRTDGGMNGRTDVLTGRIKQRTNDSLFSITRLA